MSRSCALVASTWSYHFIRTCCSDRMWSIFSPTTPHDFHSEKAALIFAWVSMSGCRVQIHTPMCLPCAYFTSVGTQLALQPASTST